MGARLFPLVKWPGHGVNHPPPSSPEVKGRAELYLNSAFIAGHRVNFTVCAYTYLAAALFYTSGHDMSSSGWYF
jgi:hypothetical protein